MFCPNCNNALPDNATFCNVCGVNFQPAPQMMNIVPAGKKIRYGCPACKAVSDVTSDAACPSCGNPTAPGGYIKLYRMGSFYGIANGFGIYIDGVPTGYIGNKQTCWIRVPYGTHRLHVAVGLSRKCEDVAVTIAPDHPLEALKVYMKPGFFVNTFKIIAANPTEVPDQYPC